MIETKSGDRNVSKKDVASEAQNTFAPLKSYIKQSFSIDLRALAAFRIGVGAILFLDYLVRATNATIHYSDAGVLPRDAVLNSHGGLSLYSLYFLNGSSTYQIFLLGISAVVAACLCVGFRTRTVTVLSWFLVASIQDRNPLVLTSGDSLLKLLLFWSIFIPLGARYSLDAFFNRSPQIKQKTVLSTWSAAILIQAAAIYFFVALHKTGSEWTTEGSAVFYALSFEQMRTYVGQLFLTLPFGILRFLSFSTLYFQYVGPLLLFVPWSRARLRIVVPLGFVGLQVGFGACLSLGLFPWISAMPMILFLPAEVWDWAEIKFLKRPAAISIAEEKINSRAIFVQVVGFILMLDMIKINISTVKNIDPWPKVTKPIEMALRLNQNWKMFSPRPPREAGWYVVPGELADGTTVDVLHETPEVSWRKPASIADQYSTNRWQKFMLNLAVEKSEKQRKYFARYLCNHWNEHADEKNKLLKLHIYYMTFKPQLDRPPAPVVKNHFWTQNCFAATVHRTASQGQSKLTGPATSTSLF